MDEPPDPIEFFRQHVSCSVPCILRRPVPCLPSRLTLDDIVDRCGESLEITVDVTPDGHGDCIRTVAASGNHRKMFVKPQERRMSIGHFRRSLRSTPRSTKERRPQDEEGNAMFNQLEHDHDGKQTVPQDGSPRHEVVYYSRQNDCLRTELKPLWDLGLFPSTFEFAEKAFGTGPPDAVNLWIGNQDAVSSMHKDHYENLFYVLSGEKVFTLCPPADAPFLHLDEYDSGRFVTKGAESGWAVEPDDPPQRVKWIEPDVTRLKHDNGYARRFPLLRHTHPLQVRVRQGEMLYLPSLWFHHVTQTCETVGINYWFDMRFDTPLWCYFNLLQQLQLQPQTGEGNEQSAAEHNG